MSTDSPHTSLPLFRRLFLEGLVIVVSILAAFALDTWWDGVQSQREERETLEALGLEFGQAGEHILFYRSIQERVLQSVSAVTDTLHRAYRQGRTRVTLPDTALGWAFIPPTTSVSLGTLQGLTGAGRLSLIRDPDLRASLASWGSTLQELSEEELDSRAYAYSDLHEALRARMDTYGLWSAANRLFEGTLSDEERAATRQVPVDSEMVGVFDLRRSLLVHTLSEFDPLLAEVDSILARIDRSLGGPPPRTDRGEDDPAPP